jgi:hypothetical protein
MVAAKKREGGQKKHKWRWMRGGQGAVLAMMEKHFGHLHQHQSLLLLLHDERY